MTKPSDKYLQSIKTRGYENLKITEAEKASANDTVLMQILQSEGEALLAAESNPKCDKKRLQETLAITNKNPYVRARQKILNDLSNEKRKHIETLELEGKTNHPSYEEFVKQIAKLGDQFSEKSS